MRFADLVRVALRPMKARKLESGLIVMAVALGVGVVTAMLALILNGLEQERAFANSLSARELLLVVRSNDYRAFDVGGGVFNPVVKIGKATDKPVTLAQSDLEPARRACPAIKFAYLAEHYMMPEASLDNDPARFKDVHLLGITREYIEAAGLTLLAGSWLSGNDIKSRLQLVVITEWFARKRFGNPQPEPGKIHSDSSTKPNPNPTSKPGTLSTVQKPFDIKDVIGQFIQSKGGTKLRIIGVFTPPKGGSDFATDQQPWNAEGIVPIGIQNSDIWGSDRVELKFLPLADQFDAAREQLRTFATRRFGEGVAVRAQRDQIAANLAVTRNAAIVTALFASGGLMIAALNITNLMLARVLGRTRGIGISGALGASSRLIFGLFLTESLVLGLFGGVLGMLLARGIAVGLEANLKRAGQPTGMDLTLHPTHFALGLLVALLVSVLFGAYPAWMASRVRPSEALRG